MSKTETFSVHQGLLYAVRARATGKWDYVTNQTFNKAGETTSISMSAYDGLNGGFEENYQSGGSVDFSNTVLPWKWEYSTSLSTNKYCLMPVGATYDNIVPYEDVANFDVIGNPTISADRVVSNFSSSNYLKMKSFPTSVSSYEIFFKFKTGSSISTWQAVLGQSTTNTTTPQLAVNDLGQITFAHPLADGTWGTSIKTSVSANTTYWVKCSWDGSYTKLEVSTDGETYTTIGTEANASLKWSEECCIGIDTGAAVWGGIIDLSVGYIKINGETWWTPYVKAPKTGLSSTLTLVGNPTISEGMASGFSSSNYITKNTPTTATKMYIKLKAPSDYTSNYQVVTDGNIPLIFAGSARYYYFYNTQSGYIDGVAASDFGLDIWFKFEYSNGNIIISSSTDGVTYTQNYSQTWNKDNIDISQIGYGDYTATGSGTRINLPFKGSIYLEDFYMTDDNDNVVWRAIQNATESLVGCTYNFTDDGSATTLNCFVIDGDESVVLTPDNSYTNGYLLGTVSIPSHTVYTYNNGVWTEAV